MGKIAYDEITIAEQSSDPALPPSGFQNIYPKTDGKIYSQNASGLVTDLTLGSSGGGGDYSYQDVLRLKTILNNI